MSKAKLKKALAALDKEEIITMVTELYDARKEAKEYLEYWIDPDAGKELERVEKLVDRQFFTPQGVSRRTLSLPTINKLIKDFMSICFEPERVADLLIYTAERMADWLEVRYRRVAYRTSLRKYLNEATLYVESHELEPLYGIRIERLQSRVEALENYQEEHAPRRWGWRRR
ncbi:hypothetical protein HDR69_03575 [bacterium]|nr:hypothetical protein [Bacteroidales bacterium]MBD5339433.1 hypothetical protein [Bacteroides sp.]MBD5385489.1 hypothetical protein [bacterium]